MSDLSRMTLDRAWSVICPKVEQLRTLLCLLLHLAWRDS